MIGCMTCTGGTELTQDNCRYALWNGYIVRVPEVFYYAGGHHLKYSPEKVRDTLRFYFRHLMKGDVSTALREQDIEKHHPRLFDLAARAALAESKNGLFDNLEFTLGKDRMARIAG